MSTLRVATGGARGIEVEVNAMFRDLDTRRTVNFPFELDADY